MIKLNLIKSQSLQKRMQQQQQQLAKQCKIVGSSQHTYKQGCLVRRAVGSNEATTYYTWNSEELNQILYEEIHETFPTYYDDLKNLDDTWKPISLQGENSKALLFLPFLPKWEIQNDKRVFTGIWDVRNKQQYDLNEKFVQKIWPQIQLLDQRIMGTLLANGCVDAKKIIRFSFKRAQNVYWKYIFLKPFANLAPRLRKIEDKHIGKIYYGYQLCTRSVFGDYRELFYPNGKKIVPQCVSDLLQAPEGLAEIYMDVGGFNQYRGNSAINTYSFQREEQEFIQQQLHKFHGLESSIYKDREYLFLYLQKKQVATLIAKIYDHLLPMFYYKLGLENNLQSHEMEPAFNLQDLRELQRNLNGGICQ